MTFSVNVKQWRERLRGRERHTHTHSLLGKIFIHLRHEKSSHSAAGLNTVIWRSLSLPRAGKCHCVPDTQILGNQVNPLFFRREPNPSVEQWWNCSSYNLLAAHHLLRWFLDWDGRVRPVMGSSTAFPPGDKTEGPWDISHAPFSTFCCWWKEQVAALFHILQSLLLGAEAQNNCTALTRGYIHHNLCTIGDNTALPCSWSYL